MAIRVQFSSKESVYSRFSARFDVTFLQSLKQLNILASWGERFTLPVAVVEVVIVESVVVVLGVVVLGVVDAIFHKSETIAW